MKSRIFLAVLSVITVLIIACQPQTTPEYKVYTDATKNNVSVKVSWREDPGPICKILTGGHTYLNAEFLGCSTLNEDKNTCTIVMPKPKDFNDKDRLFILGHEFMHCLGAAHE